MTDVCAIGGVDDGTLRVCCSTHLFVLCAHHYAVTHFVETMPAHDPSHACNRLRLVEPADEVKVAESVAPCPTLGDAVAAYYSTEVTG